MWRCDRFLILARRANAAIPAAVSECEHNAAQIKKMMATFNDLDIKDRSDRLSFIAAAVRPVESSQELSKQEAGKVIDALAQVANGTLDMIYVDGTIQLAPADTQPMLPDED